MHHLKDNKQRIYNFLLIAVAFTIPFPPKIHAIGYSIITLAVCWLLLGDWKNKWLQLKNNPVSLIFLLYYPLMVLGYFYSENKTEAKFLLEKDMPLFALPLIILSGPKINEQTIYNIVKSFIISCFLVAVYALGKAVYLYVYFNESHFYYKEIESMFDVHTTYFSMYLCFSVLLIAVHTYINRKNLSGVMIISKIFIGIFFIFFMYLLAARMPFFVLISFATIIMLYFFYKKGKLMKGLVIIAVSIIVIFSLISTLWHTHQRFYYALHPQTWEWQGYKTRNEWLNKKVLWGCNLEAIASTNLLIGAGTGDSWESVMPCYKKWDFVGYYEKYNAHNQYFETMLRLGIMGLSVWLFSLFIPFWFSLQKKHIYYVLLIAIFAIGCFTETMLDRQHGVVFYSFFNAVFFSCFLLKK